MISFIRRLIIFAIILSVVVGMAAFAFLAMQPSFYRKYVGEKIIAAAKGQRINLTMKDPELSLTNFKAEGIEVTIPQLLLTLKIEKLLVHQQIIALLRKSPTFDLNAALYGGTLTGTGLYNLVDGNGAFDLSLRGASPSSHPYLAALGITSGTLDLDVTKAELNAGALQHADLSLNLNNLNKAASKFPVPVQGSVMLINIPEISALNVQARAKLTGTQFKLESLRSTSSIAEIVAAGNVGHENLKPKTIDITAQVGLTPTGQTLLGPFLPLISQDALTAETTSFEIKILGDARRPRRIFQKL